MKTRIIKITVLVGLVILLGYLRDVLFVRITWYEKVQTEGAFPPAPHWLFQFLANLSYRQLIITRYIFTAVFIGFFYGTSWLMVKWFFYSRENVRIVLLVFAAVAGVAIITTGLGWLTGHTHGFYAITRYTIGIIETPVVVMVLFPLFWASRKFHQ